MTEAIPILHLLCGKVAAGKSTLADQLAASPLTIKISEDAWLSRLFPGEINTVDDYIQCSGRLREAMGQHIQELLAAGVSVVLDFPANTVRLRQWMRRLADEVGVRHELHYMDVTDEVCKARLRQRNKEGTHEFAASEADFDAITTYFMPPTEDEGLNVTVHRVHE